MYSMSRTDFYIWYRPGTNLQGVGGGGGGGSSIWSVPATEYTSTYRGRVEIGGVYLSY